MLFFFWLKKVVIKIGKHIQNPLIAPLDWGLGHATRCVPLVEAFLKLGLSPKLAGAGPGLRVLQDHFPQLEFRELPAYSVRYKDFFSLLSQLPRLSGVIQQENKVLQSWVDEGWIDGVISDNRYGLYNKAIPSAFVCHQLAPLPPFGGEAAHWLSHKVHRYFIRHFDQLWIPDFPGAENLSGKLSHHFGQEDARLRWLGPLSRYTESEKEETEKKWDIVALLSGPEPQRSMLEEKLRPQLAASGKKTLLIQGMRDSEHIFEEKEGYTICNYLGGEVLANTLRQAHFIIARPGYSSLMDFAALGLKKLILIPTPGQTEQEYLAERLVDQNRAWVEKQGAFSLERALMKMREVGEIGIGKEGELVQILKKVVQNGYAAKGS